MSFEIEGDGLDVARLRADVERRVEERRQSGLYTEDELRYIAERPLEPVLHARDVSAALLEELRARDSQWNYSFDPETLYRSSRGALGQVLALSRRLLRPVQKLFWNPTPMIAALSRQSDLNRFTAHLLHNLVLELTRLNLEVAELKNRNLQLQGRVELLARRSRALEDLVAERGAGAGEAAAAAKPREPGR
ncbi:MAG: hypothetical protein ACHQM7_00580 [Vicinamibacterales bacterium]|jgi:hypothetical protein